MRAINLIPADQRTDAAIGGGRSKGAAYAVLALLGGVALLALLYGMARHQVSSRQAKAAALSAKYQQIQGAAQGLARYSSFIALREERMRAVSQLIESRFDWAHAFHELGRVLPNHASIDSLVLELIERARGQRLDRSELRVGGRLGDAAQQRSPDYLAGVRDKPGGGRAHAQPSAPDRRRQRSHAPELD